MRPTLWVVMWSIIVAGCDTQPPASPSLATQSTIQASVVEVTPVLRSTEVEITGVLTAKVQATLAPKVSGLVQEVYVREGDRVQEGQPLVRLEAQPLRAEVARTAAELDLARIHLQRMERLHAEDSVATRELDEARRAFRVAQAQHQAALARLRYTIIKAPFDGLITGRMIEPGEFAGPGQSVLTMEDPSSLQLVISVPETDLAPLAIGKTLPVTIDAVAPRSSLTGTIDEIVPAGDPATHTFLVKLKLPSRHGLRSGMFGRALLTTTQTTTLVVPVTSVLVRHDLTGIYVVGPENVLRLRWIKTGKRFSDETVEVLSGLRAGERVLRDASLGHEGAVVVPSE
ncbi:MAG: efflux RND transporter periplasmic adaptor subunit [Nitrospirae bacterium]|nr:MAG: efflux RND transporter periplasmic adaptor subunit [Nitrospirota bacterium]